MGVPLPVPEELTRFLNRRTPLSLLVEVPPGTGKSTLAMELMHSFPGKGIYVSGRVHRDDVLIDYPWIAGEPATNKISVIDTTSREPDLATALRVLGASDKVVSRSEPSVDLRALLLPPEILEAWSRTSPREPTIVVLDSWEAIVERHTGRRAALTDTLPSPEEIERIALAQMAHGPVALVIIVEHRAAGQLEYLVDGVVTMEREILDDRLERWLRIDKLRGTLIEHPSYPFSLAGGRFRCIPPLRINRGPPPTLLEPAPSESRSEIWPGSIDYAAFFGSLPTGKLTLIEHDSDVPQAVVSMLLNPIIGTVLEGKGRIFYVPPPGVHPTDIWRSHKDRVTKEVLFNQVRIMDLVSREDTREFEYAMIPLPSGNLTGFDPRAPEAVRFLTENPEKSAPNLVLEWVAGLKAINSMVPGTYIPETLPGMALTYLNMPSIHTIWVGPEDDPLTHSLRAMAATRIRLRAREGRVFVHGILPHTPALVVSEGDEKEPYRLLLVV